MINFRRTEEGDLATIESWIKQDPPHIHIDPKFFLATDVGVSCYAIEEGMGGAVMFVRQEVQGDDVVLHVQFPPFDRKRVFAALREGYPIVAKDAKARGKKRIRFDSVSSALIRAMLAMGFRSELIADL